MTSSDLPNYVVVAGTFDLLHRGHLRLFARAERFGKLCILVNTDNFVEEYKGHKPYQGEMERVAEIVRVMEGKAFVSVNDNADLTVTIDNLIIRDQIVGVVFGDDYDTEAYRCQTLITPAWQAERDIALIQLPRTPGISSTMLREDYVE